MKVIIELDIDAAEKDEAAVWDAVDRILDEGVLQAAINRDDGSYDDDDDNDNGRARGWMRVDGVTCRPDRALSVGIKTLRDMAAELRRDTAQLDTFEIDKVPFGQIKRVAERAQNRALIVAQFLEYFAGELEK